MRALIPALAALLLVGCNQVYSRAPLIPEARQAGDPELRPGLYEFTGYTDPNCTFDIRRPLREWPECAAALEYRSGQRGQMWWIGRHTQVQALTMRLQPDPAANAPILLQVHWSLDALADPRAPKLKGTDNPFFGWTYARLTVIRTDPRGHILTAQLLDPACGPIAEGQAVTDRPFPGLKLSGQNCVAGDLKTVHDAIARSELLVQPATLRWVRDVP